MARFDCKMAQMKQKDFNFNISATLLPLEAFFLIKNIKGGHWCENFKISRANIC